MTEEPRSRGAAAPPARGRVPRDVRRGVLEAGPARALTALVVGPGHLLAIVPLVFLLSALVLNLCARPHFVAPAADRSTRIDLPPDTGVPR